MAKTLLFFFLSCILTAQTKPAKKESFRQLNGSPFYTLFNINNVAAWYAANGEQEHSREGNSGAYFPKGTSTAIFSSGLLWGGKVSDGGSQSLRVNGHMYSESTEPGAILDPASGAVQNPSDPNVRIWRVRKDYAAVDLQRDASEYYQLALGTATQEQVETVRNQYQKDWLEWPAQYGAPFYDAEGDGLYNPRFMHDGDKEIPVLYPAADEPGLLGADQLIWYVFNDVKNESPWSSLPIGIEVQNTVWGYKRSDEAGNIIFKRHRIIYKGLPSTAPNAKIEEMYLSLWSDPDLGDAGDDYVGCDSTAGTGFVYNARSHDIFYSKHGIIPPVVGYILLQGPTIPSQNDSGISNFTSQSGRKNLPLTSFIYLTPFLSSECFGYSCLIQLWNIFHGLPPTPMGPPPPPPMKSPVTGQPTYYWLSGNPVDSTGWVDGIVDPPGDRRMWMNTGPFTMAKGDTQEIVYALVGALGSTHRRGVDVFKYTARTAREMYRNMINEPDYDVPEENDSIFVQSSTPQFYSLVQNYPNPFNPSTVIEYDLPYASSVDLSVYDVLGKRVAVLVHGEQSEGKHQAHFSSEGLASGVYLYRLAVHANGFRPLTIQKKMMIVR